MCKHFSHFFSLLVFFFFIFFFFQTSGLRTETSLVSTFVLPTTLFTAAPDQTIVPNYTTTYLNPTAPINLTTSTVTVDIAAAISVSRTPTS